MQPNPFSFVWAAWVGGRFILKEGSIMSLDVRLVLLVPARATMIIRLVGGVVTAVANVATRCAGAV